MEWRCAIEPRGGQVRRTSVQPYGFHSQLSAFAHSDLRGRQVQVRCTSEQAYVFNSQLSAFAHMNCMVVKGVAPLNNLMASIRGQVHLPIGTAWLSSALHL